MSITVHEVTKQYGSQWAVNGVSFEVKEGEIAGFIGPNGAGKSTMMKIICSYISATSGTVTVNGYDVQRQSKEVRRHIGYLPEHNPLYEDMYVREYLIFVAGLYRLGKLTGRRVAEMIEATGLGAEQHKKIGRLSKGYRQRVGLAQALIHHPSVLILDEPTTGLDPNQIIEIRNLILEMGKSKTVLLSTHIMQEVEAICRKTVIIDKGVIVADAAVGDMQRKSESGGCTVIVEFSAPLHPSDFSQMENIGQLHPLEENKWLIQSKKGDIREDLFRFAVDRQLAILELQLQEKSLEEIFHELTSRK
ncbi:MAG: gliding motility-associated ABC transporter ATP-binding subunit GldA [Bacteroidales bacterium]|jgi:ABC-2 type transport system ATP-binding protein|nr:gliding motility-associated ABC transporter ATP-binding subunit GldA [Bacteroidales bacterium]